jgi:hypothetical protein
MGASHLLLIKKPLLRSHFRARSWGLSLEFVGGRVNKISLIIKAYCMFLEDFRSLYGGGGGN